MNARMLATRAMAAGAALRAAVCTTLCTAPRTCLCIFFCAFLPATSALAQAGDAQPYKVSDGSKVDAHTLSGWRTWRALACERCHGAAQEGMVGPSLVNSLKVLSKDQFKEAVLKGRIDKGMPNFDGSKMVVENIDNLYAYLKGRSDGAIQPGRLQEIGK